VRSARVHLAIPDRSVLFVTSVSPRHPFADLFAGAQMDRDSVNAIRNLVAGSIPELQPENVSIIDQRGRLLSDDTQSAAEE